MLPREPTSIELEKTLHVYSLVEELKKKRQSTGDERREYGVGKIVFFQENDDRIALLEQVVKENKKWVIRTFIVDCLLCIEHVAIGSIVGFEYAGKDKDKSGQFRYHGFVVWEYSQIFGDGEFDKDGVTVKDTFERLYKEAKTGENLDVGEELKKLVFKSNDAAFEFACKYLDCSLKEGFYLPAIIVDIIEDNENINNLQMAKIKVPNDEGGFEVSDCENERFSPKLKVGDLVGIEVYSNYSQEVYPLNEGEELHPDFIYCFIMAKLNPIYEIKEGNWRVAQLPEDKDTFETLSNEAKINKIRGYITEVRRLINSYPPNNNIEKSEDSGIGGLIFIVFFILTIIGIILFVNG